MEKAETDSDLVSISSEAFGLLVLENHFDRWLDIYKQCGGGIGVRGSKIPKDIISTIQPRYTRGGLKNGKCRQIGIGKGWSMEGIFRFNKLVQFVRQDHFKNPDFVTNWLKSRKQDEGSKSRKRNGPLSPEGYAQWTLSEKESNALIDTRNRKKMDDVTKRLKLQHASNGGSNRESQRSPKKVLMNELNILKAQEVVREPNLVGTPKKDNNKVGKGNDRNKKRNSTNSGSPSGPATKKRQGPLGIRL